LPLFRLQIARGLTCQTELLQGQFSRTSVAAKVRNNKTASQEHPAKCHDDCLGPLQRVVPVAVLATASERVG
jgi:hypothetical protein